MVYTPSAILSPCRRSACVGIKSYDFPYSRTSLSCFLYSVLDFSKETFLFEYSLCSLPLLGTIRYGAYLPCLYGLYRYITFRLSLQFLLTRNGRKRSSFAELQQRACEVLSYKLHIFYFISCTIQEGNHIFIHGA